MILSQHCRIAHLKYNRKSHSKRIKFDKRKRGDVTFGVDYYDPREDLKKLKVEKGKGFAGTSITEVFHWEAIADNIVDSQKNKLKSAIHDANLTNEQRIDILDEMLEELVNFLDLTVITMQFHSNQEAGYFAQRGNKIVMKALTSLGEDIEYSKLVDKLLLDKELKEDQKGFLKNISTSFNLSGRKNSKLDLDVVDDHRNRIEKARIAYLLSKNNHDLDQVEITDFIIREKILKMGAHKYIISRERKTYFNFSKESILFIIKNSTDSSVRQFIYQQKFKNQNDLQKTFEGYMQERNDYAKLLSLKPYQISHTNLSLGREKQLEFLNSLHKATTEQALVEKEKMLSALKKSGAFEKKESIPCVKPWDLYHLDQQFQSNFTTDNVSHYFPVDVVLNGIYSICKDIFDVTISPVAIEDENEVWHSSVIKLEVTDNQSKNSGTIYLDIFERPFKLAETGVFPIKLISARSNEAIFALMTSFPPDIKFFTMDQISTLLKLFGHAMHVVCSKSKLHFTSGHKTYLDFFDTPGQTFAYMANDHRFLKRLSKHHQTGAEIPISILEQQINAKKMLNATKIQWQLYIAMLDHELCNSSTNILHSTQISSKLMEKFTNISYPTNTSWHFHNEKLITHDTTQYIKLYSTFLSWKIWKSVFEKDPFDSKTTQKFKDNVLQTGGNVHPSSILERLVGKTSENDYEDFVKNVVLPPSFHTFD
jgi:Zn-dependent oligopeptidase